MSQPARDNLRQHEVTQSNRQQAISADRCGTTSEPTVPKRIKDAGDSDKSRRWDRRLLQVSLSCRGCRFWAKGSSHLAVQHSACAYKPGGGSRLKLLVGQVIVWPHQAR